MDNVVITMLMAIMLGTLAGIVYSLRILFLVNEKMERIEIHLERLVEKILREEKKIEKEELKIEKEI